jgi:hypothetical protein
MNYYELLLTNNSVPQIYTADKGKIFQISYHTHITATTLEYFKARKMDTFNFQIRTIILI